jgi:hypothetical protein
MGLKGPGDASGCAMSAIKSEVILRIAVTISTVILEQYEILGRLRWFVITT